AGLKQQQVHIVYNEPVPQEVTQETTHYFYSQIAAFLRIAYPHVTDAFFPQNNHIYLAADLKKEHSRQLAVIAIPSDHLPRFFSIQKNDIQYVIFIDDIIKAQLPLLWPEAVIDAAYSFKVTRDAEID